MPAKDHPVFKPLPDETRLWRYLDFTKYIAMLNAGALYFSRADLLGDPFEGSRSLANYNNRRMVYGENDLPPRAHAALTKLGEWERQWTYINCWNANDHESAAMWRLYAKSNDAVAVQTTFKQLQHALPDGAFLGKVNYLDYQKDWVPEGNALARYVCKRTSFEHEREVRAVVSEPPSVGPDLALGTANSATGKLVAVDLSELVLQVYVAPTASTWLGQLTEQVTQRFGFAWPIKRSMLDATPMF